MDRFERVRLNVLIQEGDVGNSRVLSVLAPELQEGVAAVDGNYVETVVDYAERPFALSVTVFCVLKVLQEKSRGGSL